MPVKSWAVARVSLAAPSWSSSSMAAFRITRTLNSPVVAAMPPTDTVYVPPAVAGTVCRMTSFPSGAIASGARPCGSCAATCGRRTGDCPEGEPGRPWAGSLPKQLFTRGFLCGGFFRLPNDLPTQLQLKRVDSFRPRRAATRPAVEFMERPSPSPGKLTRSIER